MDGLLPVLGILNGVWLVTLVASAALVHAGGRKRHFQRLATGVATGRSKDLVPLLLSGIGLFVLVTLAHRLVGARTHTLADGVSLAVAAALGLVYRVYVYPLRLKPRWLNAAILKQVAAQYDERLRNVKLGNFDLWSLRCVLQRHPSRFLEALKLVLRYKAYPSQVRQELPAVDKPLLLAFPTNYFNFCCANCAHWALPGQAECPRCQHEKRLAGVQAGHTMVFRPEAPGHLLFDIETGTLALNLAREKAWALTDFRPWRVELDFAEIPNPDLFLNRLLTTFPLLKRTYYNTTFAFAGLETLSENTRRLLEEEWAAHLEKPA